MVDQFGNLAEECSRFSQQQDSNAHCGRDENHCTASVSLHITHLFCGGIPEVDRLRDRAGQIRCKPQKEKDFDRPPLHQHQSSTRSRPDANSLSPERSLKSSTYFDSLERLFPRRREASREASPISHTRPERAFLPSRVAPSGWFFTRTVLPILKINRPLRISSKSSPLVTGRHRKRRH